MLYRGLYKGDLWRIQQVRSVAVVPLINGLVPLQSTPHVVHTYKLKKHYVVL
jgi:hypothetical protein